MRAVVVSILLVAAGVAHADDMLARRAEAQALFKQAVQLRAQHHEPQACALFEKSFQDNPEAAGTVLNIALCNEENGKFATAVKLFRRSRELALEHQLTAEQQAADEHLAKDEPLVAHLALTFVEDPGISDRLVIDSQLVPVTNVHDIALDPGMHRIEYSSPGHAPYATTFDIDKGAHVVKSIPQLAVLTHHRSAHSVVGITVGASGLAMIATGVVLGVVAHGRFEKPFSYATPPADMTTPYCEPSSGRCNSPGLAQVKSAQTLGWVGTGVGIAGVVAVSVGTWLWLSHRHEQAPPSVALVPTVAPDQAGLAAVGRF